MDRCACCAPHVDSTGEVGVIKILDSARHRGGQRVSVICGMDALEDYRARQESVTRSLPERMAEFEAIHETDEFDSTISRIVVNYIDKPNNGTKEKIDAEAAMRRLFPQFDWDKFLSNMKPHCVCPEFNGNMGFCINDGFGSHIFCSAVAELDEELRFLRWDNM